MRTCSDPSRPVCLIVLRRRPRLMVGLIPARSFGLIPIFPKPGLCWLSVRCMLGILLLLMRMRGLGITVGWTSCGELGGRGLGPFLGITGRIRGF